MQLFSQASTGFKYPLYLDPKDIQANDSGLTLRSGYVYKMKESTAKVDFSERIDAGGTLVVTGEGKLVAKGGAAYKGGNGQNGKKVQLDSDDSRAGNGGDGGKQGGTGSCEGFFRDYTYTTFTGSSPAVVVAYGSDCCGQGGHHITTRPAFHAIAFAS